MSVCVYVCARACPSLFSLSRFVAQAFEKEAENERQEIGMRAINNLERRTNQLLRIWSVFRQMRSVSVTTVGYLSFGPI